MDIQLEQRLNILLSSGTISKTADEAVRSVIKRLAQRWNLILTEKNGGRLITHLAMALARCEKGEMVQEMEKAAMAEFRACENFAAAAAIAEDMLSQIDIVIPAAEREYLEANFCLVLDDQ